MDMKGTGLNFVVAYNMESLYLHFTFRRRGSDGSGLKGLLRTLEVFQPLPEVSCHQRESLLQCYLEGNKNSQKLNFYTARTSNTLKKIQNYEHNITYK